MTISSSSFSFIFHVVRKRDMTISSFKFYVSGKEQKSRKGPKLLFTISRRRTDGSMQRIHSLVLQNAVRPQVATTTAPATNRTAACSLLLGCELCPASVRRPRPASVRPSVRPSGPVVCRFLCPSVALVFQPCLY